MTSEYLKYHTETLKKMDDILKNDSVEYVTWNQIFMTRAQFLEHRNWYAKVVGIAVERFDTKNEEKH